VYFGGYVFTVPGDWVFKLEKITLNWAAYCNAAALTNIVFAFAIGADGFGLHYEQYQQASLRAPGDARQTLCITPAPVYVSQRHAINAIGYMDYNGGCPGSAMEATFTYHGKMFKDLHQLGSGRDVQLAANAANENRLRQSYQGI